MSLPPPLLQRPFPFIKLLAPLIFAAFLSASLAARFILTSDFRLPSCGMRLLFNLPCLFCGVTRSLQAISNLDFISSFRFNPLLLLSFVVSASSFLNWLANCLFGLRNLFSTPLNFSGIPIRWLLVVLILLNWTYLAINLPE